MNGKDGAQGPKGDTGDAGANGKDGAKGDDGKNGKSVAKVEVKDGKVITTFDDGTTAVGDYSRQPRQNAPKFATQDDLNALRNDMNNQFSSLRKDMYSGVASAMAVANLPQPTRPGASMVSLGVSTYQGQSAYALGVSRVSQSDNWVVKAAVTTNSRGGWGGALAAGRQL